MLLTVNVPRMGPLMKDGRIDKLFVTSGAFVERGMPLFELRVDLSAVAAQNCTPTFYVRVVSNESGWVRSVEIAEGATAAVGAVVALVTTTADEAVAGTPTRVLRADVGVVPFPWISGAQS